MPPVRVVRSVFRGLLGHAVLVKSCTIETSAAAISRILASIGGEKNWPVRGSFAQQMPRFAVLDRVDDQLLRLFRRDAHSVRQFVTRYSRTSGKSGSKSIRQRGFSILDDSRSREMIVCLHLALNIEIRRFRLDRKSASSI